MAFTRYNKRRVFTNKSFNYKFSEIFRKRGLTALTQFKSAHLKYPAVSQIEELNTQSIIWTVGQKYFKLAAEYYGDPAYWWVIAWYNQQPLEANIKGGDIIEVPQPLELILDFLDIT